MHQLGGRLAPGAECGRDPGISPYGVRRCRADDARLRPQQSSAERHAPTDRQRARAAPSPPACHRSECASGGRAFVRAAKDRRRCRAMSAAARWPPAPWPHYRGVRSHGGGCAGEEDGGRLGRIAAEARVVQREVARVGREQLQEVRLPITARRRARRRRAVSQHWSRRTGPFGALRTRTRAERRGEARQGKARQGKARHGTAQHSTARQGKERHDTARHGTARHGKARQGRRGGTTVPRFLSSEAPRRRCCRSRTRSSASSARAGR